eukprot:5901358-Prymnesium_polylepis.4
MNESPDSLSAASPFLEGIPDCGCRGGIPESGRRGPPPPTLQERPWFCSETPPASTLPAGIALCLSCS